MISSEVQRTLVKSPPELWAELSDPAALTRHLSELGAVGEIRIVRCEPEKLVEWEAEGTNGKVQIKPSGWGTKVTLSVTRELPPAEAGVEEEPAAESASEALSDSDEEPIAQESVSEEPEPIPAELESVAYEPEAVAYEREAVEATDADALDPEPVAQDPVSAPINPPPRRGFFARLFGRGKLGDAAEMAPAAPLDAPGAPLPTPEAPKRSSAIEALQARFQTADAMPALTSPEADPIVEPGADESPAETTQTHSEDPATGEPSVAEPDSTSDLAAELMDAEEVAVEEVTAVLTAVLDRLGAAHHRPFSRA